MFIKKDASGYGLITGHFAKNKQGQPIDRNGDVIQIHTSDEAIKSVYGDLWERAKPGIVAAAEKLKG